jgi:AsmA protein
LAALACLVLAAALLVIIPYLASTRIVRDRIAVEMSSWSGFRVEIGAPPQIDLWPRFRAVLTDVTLSAWDRPSNDPVVRADRVEINLSALAALQGDAVFTGATVINPELIVVQQPSGIFLPQVAAVGRIAAGIDAARSAIRKKPESPDASALPDEPFGTIRIVDGRVTPAGSQQSLLGSVSGVIEWSNLNRPGRVTGKAIVKGEAVSFDLKSTNPLLLFAGGATDITASLTSGPATANFQGKAKFGDGPFIEGAATVQTPSIADLAKWTSTRIPAEAGTGAAFISGQITGDARHLKLDAAQIDLQGNRGTGAVEFGLDRAVPGVWGSLDFAWLDAASLIDTFAPLATGTGSPALPMTVDLRLSAARATVGTVALDGVAATVQVKDGLAVFDISDSSAFGGTIQAGLRFDRGSADRTVEMRLLASDIDGGALASAAGMKRLLPIGRGTVSVILKGPAETLEGMMERANGSVSASFGPGAITGIDLQEFLRRSNSAGFFPLSDMAEGNLPIDGLDLEATISNGVAKINRGIARMGDRSLRISGIVPYMGQSLALTGTLSGLDGRDETSFFVGGSWNEPFVTPTLTNPPLE